MPRGRVLTAEIKIRIGELNDRGLTAGEIAGALRINKDTVRKYLEVKKDVQQNKTNPGPAETDRERRHRAPRKRQDQKEPGETSPDSQHHSTERINFIGGKKHLKTGGSENMNKKEEETETIRYVCPKCNHKWVGSPDKCPSCGVELQE